MRLRYCLFLSGCLLFSVTSLRPQETQEPRSSTPIFRSKVRVVAVDVVVTDNKDKPVSGLAKNDFEILEDGQRQTISSFEEHTFPFSTRVKLPPMPTHVYTNFPVVATSDAVNVLLLDWLNTKPSDQTYVHAQVVKYLKEMTPGARLAVFILGNRLRPVHGVTSDSKALLATLENSKEKTDSQLSSLSPLPDMDWMIVSNPRNLKKRAK